MIRRHTLPFVLRSLPCIALLFALCAFPFAAFAQSATATLSGTVVDQNGAVIPGAEITVVNTGTSLQRHATTNDEGYFTVPLLSPGSYSVTARHEGFFVVQVPNVVLNVGDQKGLKIELKVGDVKAEVQITSEAPLISESPAVGTVVDRQFVANIPLNGRSFQSLITLTPGTVLTKSSFNEPGQFSVNGQRANANYFTVDGVSANASVAPGFAFGQQSGGTVPALSAAGGTNNLVSVDALQEFKVQTSTYAPEFGRTPGAQVQIITRSGMNAFHGTTFEFLRNDALDANNWFLNSRGLSKSPLRQHDFGFVLGGPVLLPRFGEGGRQPLYNGHDHTFFFLSYEGLRLRQPFVVITDVPSISARQNAVERIKPFLSAFPIQTGTTKPNGFAEFAGSFSNPSTLNATSIRIDHAAGKKLTLFGRYNFAPSSTVPRGGTTGALSTLSSTKIETQTLTLGATLIANQNTTNDLRLNYTRYRGSINTVLDTFGGAQPIADSVISSNFSESSDLFGFAISGGVRSTLALGTSASNLQRQINLVDNLSLISGPHQLKFGIDYRHLSPLFNFPHYRQVASFSSVSQAGSGTAAVVAVGTFQQRLQPLITNVSLYAQDTWKASRRLTLTYGLRYEVNPPPTERNGNDQFTLTGLDNLSTLSLAPRGTKIYKTTYDNFAPRIGATYFLLQKPGREMVLRGGFGIFYDLGIGPATANFSGGNFPFAATANLSNIAFPLTPPLATPPNFDLNPPTITSGFYVFDPNLKLPLTYQWNVAVEQSFGSNQTLSAAYVGAAGRRLLRTENLFNPNPRFALLTEVVNSGTSDYKALQLQYHRRLSKGLQGLVSYTWAHSIDNASNEVSANAPTGRLDPQLERGSSDFDVRHALNAAMTFDLPSPAKGIGKILLGNWSVDSIVTARSATPVNVLYARNIGFGFFNFRPNVIPGIPIYIADPNAPGGRRLNDAAPTAAQLAAAGCASISSTTPAKGAFCSPLAAQQGNLGRNAIRGIPVYELDVTVRRQFNLTERLNLRFGTDFFNVFNHPNFADPVATITSSSFGYSTSMLGTSLQNGSGGLSPLYQVGGPRSIQFWLKLNF